MELIHKKHFNERNYKIAVVALSLGLAAITKSVVKKSWSALASQEPPENPEDNNYRMTDVVIFSASLSIVTAVIKLFARQSFAKKWKQWGGKLPAHLD
ncbi:MAG: DUF4235 domain-containing protein [Marinoscillum sp.]